MIQEIIYRYYQRYMYKNIYYFFCNNGKLDIFWLITGRRQIGLFIVQNIYYIMLDLVFIGLCELIVKNLGILQAI